MKGKRLADVTETFRAMVRRVVTGWRQVPQAVPPLQEYREVWEALVAAAGFETVRKVWDEVRRELDDY